MCIAAIGCSLLAAAQAPAEPPDAAAPAAAPDLLKGEGPAPDAARPDWFLHFYGTHGWIHGTTDAERNHARQILVTRVPRFSEVRDAIRPGDVILGVNGRPFDRQPVFQFRESSTPATRAGEALTVTMWRPGWEEPRTVRIEPRDPRPVFTGDDPEVLTDEDLADAQNLGATGLRGWMFGSTQRGHQVDVGNLRRAHQIKITQVDEGSPADGILRVGDVILGIGDKPFEDHARRELGEALTRAETEEGGGRLRLLRWRDGETEPVTLQIAVMGTYSDTAPWDCAKSERIIENALAYIERRGTPIGGELGIQALVGSLGLLATGEERVLPHVREHVELLVRQVDEAGGEPPAAGLSSWAWGYANLLLTEYFLATGDRQALPAIEAYSRALARGQAMSGTWGHSMAMPDPVTGGPHGPLGGYGTMNQSSTVCWISLVLARRCGVSEPVIERAIRNKAAFLNDFIDVGTITYGDNLPGGLLHDDNGKTSAAAVGFAALGEEAGTDFFGRMTVASHSIREYGHTGHYWSDLWGGLGAARAGREACAAFLREDLWRIDLERRWDGGFGFQPKMGAYRNWDTTGSRLILFSIPRRQLAITGRDLLTVELTPEQLAEAIEAGRQPAGVIRWPERYNDLPAADLLPLLGHWSPVTREQAARSLSAREDASIEAVRAMLGSENRCARYGACTALRHLGRRAQPAVGDLIAHLDSEDRVLQVNAIMALGTTDDPRAVEALFDLAGREVADDPYDVVRRRVAGSLFGRGNLVERARAVEDRERMLGATREFLTSITGDTRTVVAHNVVPALSLEEFKALWPQIEHARNTPATTYNTEIHMATLRRLRDFRVREGIDHAAAYVTEMRGHGSQVRVPEVLEILRGYGAHARAALPELERAADYFEHEEQNFPRHLSLQKAENVRNFIRELEAMEDPGEDAEPLIAIADGWR